MASSHNIRLPPERIAGSSTVASSFNSSKAFGAHGRRHGGAIERPKRWRERVGGQVSLVCAVATEEARGGVVVVEEWVGVGRRLTGGQERWRSAGYRDGARTVVYCGERMRRVQRLAAGAMLISGVDRSLYAFKSRGGAPASGSQVAFRQFT